MLETTDLAKPGPVVNPPTDGVLFDYALTCHVLELWGQRGEWLRDPQFDDGAPWMRWSDGIAGVTMNREGALSYGEVASPDAFWVGTCQGRFSQVFAVPPRCRPQPGRFGRQRQEGSGG
jgi:hypothetical protein